MYEILIIGHNSFPSGVLSSIRLLMGDEPSISILELSDQISHEQYERDLIDYLNMHQKVLVFADLTGGAPQQIAARIILENSFSNGHFLISGMSLSTITELIMKFQFQDVSVEDAPVLIEQALYKSKAWMHYLPS